MIFNKDDVHDRYYLQMSRTREFNVKHLTMDLLTTLWKVGLSFERSK